MTSLSERLADLEVLQALVDAMPEDGNALGVAHGASERGDLWTTTREKALRKTARRFGLGFEAGVMFGAIRLTDPETGLVVDVPGPGHVRRALGKILLERSVTIALAA